MDRNLGLELVRVTEAAALATARWMGRGDKNAADQAAVTAMRRVFDIVDIQGTVVIGEGERDEAPMLYIGESVGSGKGPEVDIALDPLECTNSVAYGRPNALSAIATAIGSTGVDVLLGIGGAPEGVLAAAALRCLGGAIQGKLLFRSDEERERARKMGIEDHSRVYREGDLARGEQIVFATTGVTDGDLLPGVRFRADGADTHSMVMRAKTGTVRTIRTQHRFEHEPAYRR